METITNQSLESLSFDQRNKLFREKGSDILQGMEEWVGQQDGVPPAVDLPLSEDDAWYEQAFMDELTASRKEKAPITGDDAFRASRAIRHNASEIVARYKDAKTQLHERNRIEATLGEVTLQVIAQQNDIGSYEPAESASNFTNQSSGFDRTRIEYNGSLEGGPLRIGGRPL